LQPYTCHVARCLTEFVISRASGLFRALFMYNACDTLRNLPEIIGSALDEESTLPIMRLHVPAVSLDHAYAAGYLQDRIEGLTAELENLTGRSFSASAFNRSVELYRRQRGLCMQLEERQAQGSMSFADCAEVLMAGSLLPVEEHIALLEARLRESAGTGSEMHGHPGIMISGILPPPRHLLEVIEKAGLTVAANDIASLRRSYAYSPAPATDAGAYYEDFYRGHHPCTTILPSADSRAEYILKTAREKNVKGFIFFGEKFCEYEYFEMPHIEQMLKSSGIQCLCLEMTDGGGEQIAANQTRIETFAEMLHT
ncbi:MAG TPA: 2-hydroxyacyl-CoA dehydratase family protein, partial [Deltaproteobacteria bacterium]|nr:2-hydroxyacyl-CoA dehydratase family protein [Deltaproteobacteria bacterium]